MQRLMLFGGSPASRAGKFILIFLIVPDLLIFKISIKKQAHRCLLQIPRISHFWKRKNLKSYDFKFFPSLSRDFGGDKRDRTADLLNAIQALSQLSYTPIFGSLFGQLLYYSIPAEFVNSFFSFFQRPFFAVFRFRGWTKVFTCAILYITILTVSFRAA